MFASTSPEFQLVAIAVVATLATARLARLLVHDKWPPIKWFRERVWDAHTEGWNLLFHCHFCMAVWIAAGVVAWGYLTDWQLAWWLVNGALAVSYAAAYVVTYDGDD